MENSLSARYLRRRLRLDDLPERFLPEDFFFSALAADYHHPLLPHDQVTPLLASTGRGFAVVLRAGGRDCVSVEFIR